ncbi:MAG: class I SAM-dependent methyltransferase [Firmicutes bacterium]|nr:class I SAM-dependent methyltransferase [Bacillota bacterium]
MAEHYFTKRPSAEHKPHEFTEELRGRIYLFHTDAGVFSRDEIDLGSKLLIESMPCEPGDTVLDLGCGYGPIGMVAATVVAPGGFVYLVDVNERAVELAQKNLNINGIKNAKALVSDGLEAVANHQFDLVVSNPPIRAGKEVFYSLLTDAYKALKPSGCLLVVIRTKQGAKSLENYLRELAGNCETVAKKAGFRVLKCCKQLHA